MEYKHLLNLKHASIFNWAICLLKTNNPKESSLIFDLLIKQKNEIDCSVLCDAYLNIVLNQLIEW